MSDGLSIMGRNGFCKFNDVHNRTIFNVITISFSIERLSFNFKQNSFDVVQQAFRSVKIYFDVLT